MVPFLVIAVFVLALLLLVMLYQHKKLLQKYIQVGGELEQHLENKITAITHTRTFFGQRAELDGLIQIHLHNTKDVDPILWFTEYHILTQRLALIDRQWNDEVLDGLAYCDFKPN